MEPIDAAHAAFARLTRETERYLNSVETESDTRLKIIDRLLVEVLQWPYADINTEEASENGFADYVCRVQGRARLVVEAKRDGRSLGVEGRPSGTAFKLSGSVLRPSQQKKALAKLSDIVAQRTQSWLVLPMGESG
jgi:hypothetical protein